MPDTPPPVPGQFSAAQRKSILRTLFLSLLLDLVRPPAPRAARAALTGPPSSRSR